MKESRKLNLWFMSFCGLKTSKTQDNSKDFESLELCILSDLIRAALKTFLCFYKTYEKQSGRLGKLSFSLWRKFKLLSKLRRMLQFIFHLILLVQILTCLTCSLIGILENSEWYAARQTESLLVVKNTSHTLFGSSSLSAYLFSHPTLSWAS